MNIRIERALISVSDKTNIETLVKFLNEQKIEIISTGGTAKIIQDLGYKVIEISKYTSMAEMLDGRVKTLHPKIHGGLLARLDNKTHLDAMKQYEIPSIDLVVVNLYPFSKMVKKGASIESIIENIDIGGPSMLRSAAKNFDFTTAIVDPNDYESLINEMRQNTGAISLAFRKKMAAKVFTLTASYDVAISNWFTNIDNIKFPEKFVSSANLDKQIRYGENPHQMAALYKTNSDYGIPSAKQLQGKELSYNNILDSDATFQLITEFNEPTAVIVKHTNPCGVACRSTIEAAYDAALASDPLSAFGGIIAFNRLIDLSLAQKISALFAEVIIAPTLSNEAAELLGKKTNLRILTLPMAKISDALAIRSIMGGLLVQDIDHQLATTTDIKIAGEIQPNKEQIAELLFAFTICKHVKSNAIVITQNKATIGIGAGQMSRVDSVKIAIEKAISTKANIAGSVMASDAFLPFPDSVHIAAKAGIKAIIQPSGSIRDKEVIDAANKLGIAIIHTNLRHFKH